MFVWTCETIPQTGEQTVGLTTDAYPTCDGGGVWVESELLGSASWATTLTLNDAAVLISASVLALGVAFGFRLVFDFIRNR